ncbi:hypothetical protein F3J34_30475 [Klebsiella sp. Ap-873]|nr:hypothetical protein [Klebsiella sp. Ap-873]
MNLTFTCSYLTTRNSIHAGQMKVIAEDAQLDQLNNPAELLLQMDQKEIIEFLEAQGLTVIAAQEKAA